MDAGLGNQQHGAECSASGTTLSAKQLYQHDPLLVLLKDTWQLNDFWVIVGVIVPPGGVFLLWWFWGEYVVKGHFWLLGETFGALLQTLVLFPLLFLIYLLLPASIADLFNSLKAKGVIGERRKDRSGSTSYEDFVQQVVAWTDWSWWTAAALTGVVLYLFYRLVLIEPHIATLVPFWLRAVAVIVFSPLLYITFLSIARLLLALIFTNWLFFTFTIHIKPLHPDGSGGLGGLGRLLWLSVLIMFWDALFLSTAIFSIAKSLFSPLEMVLLAAIYLALTPSLLLGWLLFPHQVMVSARDEALQPLADEFEQALIQSLSSTERDTRALVAGTRRLAVLKQRYDLVRDTFPTWPVEISTISRLVVTVIFPLILALLTSLITLVSHALGLP